MMPTQIRDAVIAELQKLPEGAQGDRAELKAVIGCSAAELGAAIDALRMTGKIGFYGLVLSASLRLPKVVAEPVAAVEIEELATVPAPGGVAAQPPSSGQPADGDNKRALPPPKHDELPISAKLAAEIRAYCREVGCGVTSFSRAAVGHTSLIGNLDAGRRPQMNTVLKVRRFIAEHPQRLGHAVDPPPQQPPPSQDPVAVAAAPAPRVDVLAPAPIAQARQAPAIEAVALEEQEPVMRHWRYNGAGTAARAAIDLDRVRQRTAVQVAFAPDPRDLVRAVARKHPQLWRRAVDLGRAAGQTPFAALYSALEAGLSHVERELTHGKS